VIFGSSENVFPAEVENRLEEHAGVVEACVAGIDDPLPRNAAGEDPAQRAGHPPLISPSI
jgi:acyl-CoA synthetase (AMP-forming)/AMP-acid ligase II